MKKKNKGPAVTTNLWAGCFLFGNIGFNLILFKFIKGWAVLTFLFFHFVVGLILKNKELI